MKTLFIGQRFDNKSFSRPESGSIFTNSRIIPPNTSSDMHIQQTSARSRSGNNVKDEPTQCSTLGGDVIPHNCTTVSPANE
ncbi:hypothetical protein Y032_0561g3479 [Ancylostoma ceylanicum]|uniref:Uncharacterized protein n=1 Tax=Ancylostoma ceylanicum TaxID=53326 RepID=A0A016WRL4_9BILA|nr:hypothetical protein Y032_0561g3479 [Ancylostoma ceylanicum]